jgi:ribosomal protein L17
MTDDDRHKEIIDLIRSLDAQRESRLNDRIKRFRVGLLPALRQRNVMQVVLDYDGYGDSTSECTVTMHSADGSVVSKANFPFGDNELIDLLFEFVPPGYENNDGGYGQVILDVATEKVRNEHSQRYTESHYSEEEFDL